jgi:hypothetical protein
MLYEWHGILPGLESVPAIASASAAVVGRFCSGLRNDELVWIPTPSDFEFDEEGVTDPIEFLW